MQHRASAGVWARAAWVVGLGVGQVAFIPASIAGSGFIDAATVGTVGTVGKAERTKTSSPMTSLVHPGTIVNSVLTVRCVAHVDDDADGIDGGEVKCALNDHAPVAYQPLGGDWTRPANICWYLARSTLRFHHDNCLDEEIAPIGGLPQALLVAQYHRRKKGRVGLRPCRHHGKCVGWGRGANYSD